MSRLSACSASWSLVCSSSACWFSRLRLRFFQHARLLFEFLVGGAQFFLLDLQFFVERLGLGERLLQALAVLRRGDGGADALAHQLQELEVARAGGVQEADFDDAVDLALVAER